MFNNHKKHNATSKKGDENMEMTKTNIQSLDVNFILTHGTVISSQEALSGIIPIDWNKDVLDGKCKDKTIIKSKDKEDK